ncbi:MAG: 2-C-methyl-D-erythritol 4-phosphate cytidylyltransferase, partial [Deltaproteobacteria bacterium]|nr:2-C-methyl-D-erythritol 4-phosphate cytidylyltransferase [Deltaproteobacteria bacterium]
MTKAPRLKTIAIIPSAGAGVRMGSKKKNYLPLAGKAVLSRTIQAFEDCPLIDSIIAVAPQGDELTVLEDIVRPGGFIKILRIIAGG